MVKVCMCVNLSCIDRSIQSNFPLHVDCDRGSVPSGSVFDMLCASGFVDDVIFSYCESDGSV